MIAPGEKTFMIYAVKSPNISYQLSALNMALKMKGGLTVSGTLLAVALAISQCSGFCFDQSDEKSALQIWHMCAFSESSTAQRAGSVI